MLHGRIYYQELIVCQIWLACATLYVAGDNPRTRTRFNRLDS
jgi:hypothetical protein